MAEMELMGGSSFVWIWIRERSVREAIRSPESLEKQLMTLGALRALVMLIARVVS